MTDLEAIRARTSRRAYHGVLSKECRQKLEELMARVNLESGLSIRFLQNGAEAFGGITKSYGMFSGVHGLFVLAGHHAGPHFYEKAGHAGQRLVLEATKLGLGTCWVGGTFSRKIVLENLPDDAELAAVITVGPVHEKRAFMEKAVKRLAGKGKKPPEELMLADAEPPDWFKAGVAAAALAPSAMNRQPVRFVYKKGVATAHALPNDEGMRGIDLGIAKLHFEIAAVGRFEEGNGGVFTRKA